MVLKPKPKRDSGHYTHQQPLDLVTMINLLKEKFLSVDFERAKNDVMPFISVERQRDLHDWGVELFIELVKGIDVEAHRSA